MRTEFNAISVTAGFTMGAVDLHTKITKAKLLLFRCLICFNKKASLPSVEENINTITEKILRSLKRQKET